MVPFPKLMPRPRSSPRSSPKERPKEKQGQTEIEIMLLGLQLSCGYSYPCESAKAGEPCTLCVHPARAKDPKAVSKLQHVTGYILENWLHMNAGLRTKLLCYLFFMMNTCDLKHFGFRISHWQCRVLLCQYYIEIDPRQPVPRNTMLVKGIPNPLKPLLKPWLAAPPPQTSQI